MEEVILVTEQDVPIGKMEKLEAHQKNLLHRCFSIFIFNSQGQLLLQQRALDKYHCGGLWTNTCCGHPRPNEDTQAAAHRRLQEENGFACELKEVLSFTYQADFSNGLHEHEFDHVFIGMYDGDYVLNKEEAHAAKWVDPLSVLEDGKQHPEKYTVWFLIALPKVLKAMSLVSAHD